MLKMCTMASKMEPKRNQSSTESTHVCFNTEVTSCEIPNRSSFTTEQISSLWYQSSDYERMDDENDAILDVMIRCEKNSPNKNRSYCTRGLEYLLPERSNAREEARQALWDAVIDEQLHQWRTDIDDPEAIAKAYRATSTQHFEKIATFRGVMDEKQAMKIHFDSVKHKTKKMKNSRDNKKEFNKSQRKRQGSVCRNRNSREKNRRAHTFKETSIIYDPSFSTSHTSEWRSSINQFLTKKAISRQRLSDSSWKYLRNDEQTTDFVRVTKRIIVWER